MSERRRALLVANSDYGDPALSRLASPVQDAKELARVLKNEKIGGFEVETLTNENAFVVVQAIEEFFDLSEPKPDDLLLLYFSGHGVTDEEGQLYFATADTRILRGKVRQFSAVGARFVNEKMQSSRSRRQVLILDCCHSGAFSEGMRMKGAALQSLETHFQQNNQGKGRMVLTASTGTQYSFEGTAETGVRPSIYTEVLVKALESGEADLDCDGMINLDELHNYLCDQVHAKAPQQMPTKSGYAEGQLFIARSAVQKPAKLPFDLEMDLKSPKQYVRRGAIFELKKYLAGTHPGLALAARQSLVFLRDRDDSIEIRESALECLIACESSGSNVIEKDLKEKEVVRAKSPRGSEKKREVVVAQSQQETERLEREKALKARSQHKGQEKIQQNPPEGLIESDRQGQQNSREYVEPIRPIFNPTFKEDEKSISTPGARQVQGLTLSEAFAKAESERHYNNKPQDADYWQRVVVIALGIIGAIVLILAIFRSPG